MTELYPTKEALDAAGTGAQEVMIETRTTRRTACWSYSCVDSVRVFALPSNRRLVLRFADVLSLLGERFEVLHVL
jgi:hypothetical protein